MIPLAEKIMDNTYSEDRPGYMGCIWDMGYRTYSSSQLFIIIMRPKYTYIYRIKISSTPHH
jgi:hypothetical protein